MSKFSITRANHVGLNVRSLPRAISFYTECLKLPLAYQFSAEGMTQEELGAWSMATGIPDQKISAAMIALPNEVMIELIVYNSPKGDPDANKGLQLPNPGTMHFAFEVDSLDALIESANAWEGGKEDDLEGKGRGMLEVLGKQKIPKGVMAGWMIGFMRGPDGELLEIFQRPDDA